MNKIELVVSDIHCQETSAIPRQHADKMEKLWRFQNDLADGRIAANWRDVFVAQHRRMFIEGSDLYPMADIRVRDLSPVRNGMRVVLTNSWLLRLHLATTVGREDGDSKFREIITRQASNIPSYRSKEDCATYVRQLWRNDIRAGIAACRKRRDFQRSFEELGEYPDWKQLASKLPGIRDEPFLQEINEVIRGEDEELFLQRWSNMLESDPIGPCPSVCIRTAFEAELLWTWQKGYRQNPKEFRRSYGRSRQNDIDHVSAFLPYVDALTTDRDMHNQCNSDLVMAETKPFRCKIFSGRNYTEFDGWLDGLLREGNE